MENNSSINSTRNISKLNYIDSLDSIIDKYDHFIFDCDGVIWREKTIIPECVEKIKHLQKLGKKVYILTNSNRLTRKDIQNKIKTLCDIDIDLEHVYSSSYIISKYLQTHHKEIKSVFLIGEEGIEKELEFHGIKVYGGKSNKNLETNEKKKNLIQNFCIDLVHEIEIDPNIDACVCGFDQNINYFKIVYGTFVINKTGAFFGTNNDRHLRVGDRLVPCTYVFISSLETSTGIKATIVSKPDPRNFQIIMEDHNINSLKRVIMVGDNLSTDIEFANNCGIDSLLVLTGITSEETLKQKELNELNSPTYVLNHF